MSDVDFEREPRHLLRWRLTFSVAVCMATTINGAVVKNVHAEDQSEKFQNKLKTGDGYEKVTSFKEAVEVLKKQLEADGKPEYAALVSENTVRAGLRKAMQVSDARSPKEDRFSEFKLKGLKPGFITITEDGQWPSGCFFEGFYTNIATEDGVPIDGLLLYISFGPPHPPPPLKTFVYHVFTLYLGSDGHSQTPDFPTKALNKDDKPPNGR